MNSNFTGTVRVRKLYHYLLTINIDIFSKIESAEWTDIGYFNNAPGWLNCLGYLPITSTTTGNYCEIFQIYGNNNVMYARIQRCKSNITYRGFAVFYHYID